MWCRFDVVLLWYISGVILFYRGTFLVSLGMLLRHELCPNSYVGVVWYFSGVELFLCGTYCSDVILLRYFSDVVLLLCGTFLVLQLYVIKA